MTKNEKKNNANKNESDILEEGDIYFFYRPKKNSSEVKDIDDIRRFFMVTSSKKQYSHKNNDGKTLGQFYRLFVIGKKSLPEIRKSEARASERYWARVGGIFENLNDLTNELFSDEFRKGDAARPVGAGKYIIAKHQNHAEIAYVLETPREPGEAQEELGIEKEASFIISVINPKRPAPPGFPSTEESPNYPDKVLQTFDENENFVSLNIDTSLIDYLNSQVILIGAREGKDIIKRDLGIDIDEDKTKKDSDVIKKLRLQNQNIPTKPLTEGKLA
ncbi:MAG TPA: hypothetical protein VD815_10435 [Candidatus Saccharimonadales bacterium]|nr:hypothetical protein [Candidatus Saccharimonadales bacterium]